MSKTPEYEAYCGMIARCCNSNRVEFPRYGGRGIEMRFASFEEFYAEVGNKPSPKHSIDRINTNGHYEHGNVRWATAAEQNANRNPLGTFSRLKGQ